MALRCLAEGLNSSHEETPASRVLLQDTAASESDASKVVAAELPPTRRSGQEGASKYGVDS